MRLITMKKIVIEWLILGFALISLNSCATIAGIGKDLQRAGQAVEHEAEKR